MFESFVKVAFFELEQTGYGVHVGVLDDKVLEVGLQSLFDLKGKAARVNVAFAVVQFESESLELVVDVARVGKQLRVEAFERDQRFVVNFFEETFGLLAHLVVGMKVGRLHYVGRYVRLVVDVTASAEIFTKVFTVVERVHLVRVHVDTTVRASVLLLSHHFGSLELGRLVEDELFSHGRPNVVAYDTGVESFLFYSLLVLYY